MNNWKVKHPRTDLSFEIAFTKAYREAKAKFTHPAQIELAALRAQFPAIMHEIEDEDLFAGRVQMGIVGFGSQHQTGGFGYYADLARIADLLANQPGNQKYREDIHDMLTFWYAERTGAKVMADVPADLKDVFYTDVWENDPLPATPILRMAGSYPNFDKLVQVGLPGMQAEIRSCIEREKARGGDAILYECMLGAVDLIAECCLYYRDQALRMAESHPDAQRAAELRVMAQVLQSITERAPQSMREAIQLVWMYGIMAPQVEYGRADIYLGDLYVKDIDSGALSDEEALALVQSYFRLIDHLNCEVDGRLFVGGLGRRNTENADRFSLVAIEACRTVKEVLPQFTLRFSKQTPKAVWDAAMRCIEEGRSYPLLYNDDVLVPAIMKGYGVDRTRAESYVPLGCGEIEFDHYSIHTPSGSMNVSKILEIAIRGGYEPVSRKWVGPKTKALAECRSFEEFYDNYLTQLHFYIAAEAKFERYEYDKTGSIHPFLYFSMLYDGCLESGKPMFAGGCQSLNGTLELYGLVDAGDSLFAIKKLIYDEKVLTGSELVRILDNNFFGFEKERRMMLDLPKYGNDIDDVDRMVVKLQSDINQDIAAQAPLAGLDTNLSVIINNDQNTTLARWVGATPNGRKAGTPFANANNPEPGADKNGVTAMINSLLKMPQDNNAGTVQNFRFSKELFQASREKVLELIQNYFDRGGAQAMISVVGREDLKNALERPEDYRDLIVRVGGFSARFVDLHKDVQVEIYNRTTY